MKIDLDAMFPKPERNDEAAARRWRGALFWNLDVPLRWRKGFDTIDSPKSVTFPICFMCQHIIWDWPHFEEAVPENAACDACVDEAEDEWQR